MTITWERGITGRALFVSSEGNLFAGRGREVWRSDDAGASWVCDSVLDVSWFSQVCAATSFTARLCRQYIAALVVLGDGSRVAVTRDGVYRAASSERVLRRVFPIVRGSRPLNLCVDQRGRVLFGEYGDGLCDPRVYVSEDAGKTFEVLYTFECGSIRHIHNIVPQGATLWVLTGDYGEEPGIAALSLDGRTLEWVARGRQAARAVSAIPDDGNLIYGTDSDIEQNFIVALDTRSGRLDYIREIGGSCLYACRTGALMLISTCVEPNTVSRSTTAHVYASKDGRSWTEVLSGEKDFFPSLCQYGTFVLPTCLGAAPCMPFVSGQALVGNHNKLIHGQIASADLLVSVGSMGQNADPVVIR